MSKSRKYNVLFIAALVIAFNCVFMYYFHSVSSMIQEYADQDVELMQGFNDEITSKLQKTNDISEWQKIVDGYSDIIVEIKNSNGDIIASTKNTDRSIIRTRAEKAFVFNDEAYIIRTSVYLSSKYLTDTGYLFKLLVIVFGIVTIFIILIVLMIYAFMLRPMHKLYRSIEKYEKGEPVRRMNGRSEVARLQNRFVEMTETISKQQQNQRRIIASISHDIKTPLTSIMGYSEMLKKENLSEERKQRYLKTIYNKAVAIRDIVNDFDEYLSYNLDSSMKKTEMTVDRMLEDLTDGYEDELQNMGVEFVCHLEPNNDIICVDIKKMRRVIGNIIGNSVKHFDGDKKIIEVECKKKQGAINIIISDNGEGVDPEQLEVIFEPLYTSDQGRKVAGLGLAICKEIVENLGGEIHAEKSKLGGLAVVMELKTKRAK